MKLMKVAVAGATGRMGRAVLTAIVQSPDIVLTGALARPHDSACGRDVGSLIGAEATGVLVSDAPDLVIGGCDVLIDFTHPQSTHEYAEICARLGKCAVIGTTGLPAAALDRLRLLAGRTGFVVAANMSIGVNLALHLLAIAARVLGDADVEIFEAHHRHKVDAPSGTALRMGEVVANARGQDLKDVAVYDRHAQRTERAPGAIGFASLRAGEIVGEHRVFLALPAERLEIAHVAESRYVFAEGALRAARFVFMRGAGFFDMQDVLGLR
ncbi:MAG: 4-hydroxy-tetrahydrodipicolinate reductase [Acidiferrobacter sp.]